jgi:hypothetical protein
MPPTRATLRLRAGSIVLALLALLALDGWRSVARGDRETGSGATVGCRSSAFDASTDLAGIPVSAMNPVPVLATTLSHPCPGPVHVRAAVVTDLSPTGAQAAILSLRAEVTCTGGGCDVTGVPVLPPVLGVSAILRESTAPPTETTLGLLATFPDLPAGTYTVEVTAVGLNAQPTSGQAHVFGHGNGTAPRLAP